MNSSAWSELPIKAMITVNPETLPESFPPDELISYVEISDVSEIEGISWNEPIPFGEAPSRARRLIRDGDVLASTVRTYLRAVAGVDNAPTRSVASTGFAVLRPRNVNPRFLSYALLNSQVLDEIVARSVGVSYPAINASDLISIRIPVPDAATQIATAAFLDRETAEIDAFIADQELLIGLLTERRAATISHAVTKGLDPSVPMKHSGIEWLGEVPAQWTTGQLKWLGSLTLGKMLQSTETDVANVLHRYLRAANVQPHGRLDLTTEREMWFSKSEVGRLDLLRGDVVIVEGGVGGYGRAAFVAENLHGWAFQNSIIRLRPFIERADGRFVTYVLLHLRHVGYIEMVSSVASMPHFTLEKVAQTVATWPGKEEQSAISDYLDTEVRELDAAIADAREAIVLSRERRAALISAAVTGKIDAR